MILEMIPRCRAATVWAWTSSAVWETNTEAAPISPHLLHPPQAPPQYPITPQYPPPLCPCHLIPIRFLFIVWQHVNRFFLYISVHSFGFCIFVFLHNCFFLQFCCVLSRSILCLLSVTSWHVHPYLFLCMDTASLAYVVASFIMCPPQYRAVNENVKISQRVCICIL